MSGTVNIVDWRVNMNTDFWIGFLKITSMLATGLFGALGLLTKYKDETGRITKWGKIALTGIIISSAISLTLYTLETSTAKAKAEKAREQAEATTNTLSNILNTAKSTIEQTNILKSGLEETLKGQKENLETTKRVAEDMKDSIDSQKTLLKQNSQISSDMRSSLSKQERTLTTAEQIAARSNETFFQISRMQYPINDLKVQVFLKISIDHPLLAKYKNNFELQVRTIIDDFKRSKSVFYDNEKVAVSPSGREIQLFKGNNLLPNSSEVDNLLTRTNLTFLFYKAHVESESSIGTESNLFIYGSSAFVPIKEDNKQEMGTLLYNIDDRAFVLLGITSRVKFMKTQADVLSLLDFIDADLIVKAYHPSNIDQGFNIAEIIFSNSLGQRLVIPGEQFNLISVGGEHALIYHFPRDWRDLFTRKSRFRM